jgi:hypothetical protein
MSYIVTIVQGPIPLDDQEAWKAMNAKLGKPLEGDVPKVYHVLIDRLTAKYPCICDLPEDKVDEGVWTDGPLRNNAGPEVTTLGIESSRIEEVLPFLIEVSNDLGLAVFDPQEAKVYRPKDTPRKPRWKFWA